MEYTLSSYGTIQFISPYEIQTLHEIKLIQTINDHAKLSFTGIIAEEKQDCCIEEARSSHTITLHQIEDGNIVRTLFNGIISQVESKVVRDIYYITIEAISHTYQMDVRKKSRSFQNKNMLYTKLIEAITEPYPGSDYIDTVSEGSKINTCMIQYNETDWGFLKRMASHFGAVLIAAAASEKPKFWFGMAEGRTGQLFEHPYTVKKSFPLYRKAIENNEADDPELNDYICYEVETTTFFTVGDRVTYKEKQLVIIRVVTAINNGVLTHTYTLMPEKGSRQTRIWNDLISGSFLEGRVLEVNKDTAKLHLQIDEKQDVSTAYSFPYATFYTAEGHSGWYCMPEIGDNVRLYFPTNREEKAVVMNAVRKESDSPKMDHPEKKYWGTPHEKEILLAPEEMVITVSDKQGKSSLVTIHEEDGIEIRSDHPIVVTSKKNIEVQQAETIHLEAGEAIYLVCGASSIVMDGNTDMQGTTVEMEGLLKPPVVVSEREEEQLASEEWDAEAIELAQNLDGMLPSNFDTIELLKRQEMSSFLTASIPFVGKAGRADRKV
ncbi:late control gene D protein (GPD) [Aneurinibacillus soli]|uniref:Uncharacterized protein n=1 Tax=Aneurinibacillus soli TaxID=1500254 RepID=A0A0U5C5P4_9BACL|nr:contractile injection system protein, VgrG/Pvc8 family [Aneurinibacillus soli]PYE62641.1 late control gene D protein (GPD) [Aneurinibacillus soli]BAU27203.1 hypothetical protein CB4_01372 [Aneurinibacillus soli]